MAGNNNGPSAKEHASEHRPGPQVASQTVAAAPLGGEGRTAGQAELGKVERQERDRLSACVRTRADERQQVLHERFPHLPYKFLAPIGEVAARPRIDDSATHAGALTYGSFLAIPPLLLFASSVVGYATMWSLLIGAELSAVLVSRYPSRPRRTGRRPLLAVVR